ncbi:MAG TPA: CfrBI family restriction endonuclease [Pedobacter sp.]|uniref:CfrBI family restriction endonuclease n=1 Tax=Pedobacter sp. TaxID=1411316 RepID=UPI002C2127BE|nr:CfrBI family restriction endonuclease [Pedobacter sp.]HMI01675.1 CfrBI family restriction endonuclease [Pedobacter sp.]
MTKALKSTSETSTNVFSFFPEEGKVLLTGGGKEFIERIGVDSVRNAVYSVMIGENLRSQTEPLSRRRISQVSGALIAMVTKGYLKIDNLQSQLSQSAVDFLKISRKNDNSAVWLAQWIIGLTGKSVQNVLRSDSAALQDYVKDFELAIRESADHCAKQIGDYSITLGYNDTDKREEIRLDWEGMIRLTTMIGAQTLTIRGSDKSMYGKLFEKLVLGSILTILGFKRVDPKINTETEGVFWLSDSSANRESDATLLISAGKVARFDIGFIGPGNSEISKDKLSRFDKEIETSAGKGSSVTFIIIDRLPNTGKTKAAAEKIGAEIIQMSMQYWPRELGIKLRERFGFKHSIQSMKDNELNEFLEKSLNQIKIQEFLSDISLEEIGVIEENQLTLNDQLNIEDKG